MPLDDEGMTFREFQNEARFAQLRFPTWHMGKAYMNTLRRLRPDLADDIEGTDADPFHDVGNLERFFEVVEKDW